MTKPKVAVIGAGLAGLSAAASLIHDAHIQVFEASKIAGGRTRSLNKPEADFGPLDNGQHILLGAYQSTLDLLRRANVTEEAFFRAPLRWWMDSGFQLKCPSVFAPLNLAWGVLSAQGLNFSLRLECLKTLSALTKVKTDSTVAKWLNEQGVAYILKQNFWTPLVLAAMNTSMEEASILTLAQVVQNGLLKSRTASDLLLPKKPLNNILGAPLVDYLKTHGVRVSFEHRVQSLVDQNAGILVDDVFFDRVIIATAPHQCTHLIPDNIAQERINKLQYTAICTVYLRYGQKISLPFPMVGIANGTAQWLFDRGVLAGKNDEIAVVISCVAPIEDKEDFVHKVHLDVLKWCPDLPAPVDYRIITEKRATFRAVANRPQISTSILANKGIYLAGDYTHPFYPATIEGAVQSGQIAATQCILDWKKNG